MGRLNVSYQATPDVEITAECNDLQEIFKTLGPIQEILGHNWKCGKCGGKKIRFVYRKTNEGHDVYELLCETPIENNPKFICGHKLHLGQNQADRQLFPRRYDQEKNSDGKWVKKLDEKGNVVYFNNNGWVKWNRDKECYE